MKRMTVTNKIMEGYFYPIKRVTDTTFIVKSSTQVILVHQLRPFPILDSIHGDSLQWHREGDNGFLIFF